VPVLSQRAEHPKLDLAYVPRTDVEGARNVAQRTQSAAKRPAHQHHRSLTVGELLNDASGLTIKHTEARCAAYRSVRFGRPLGSVWLAESKSGGEIVLKSITVEVLLSERWPGVLCA
jgi:hypothetical protein